MASNIIVGVMYNINPEIIPPIGVIMGDNKIPAIIDKSAFMFIFQCREIVQLL